MDISGELVIDQREMASVILNGLASALNDSFRSSVAPLKAAFSRLIDESIRATPEYDSLLHGGVLQAQLGVQEPGPVLEGIIQAIKDAMSIDVSPVRVSGDALSGDVGVSFLRDDFSEVLAVPGTAFTSENNRNVDWLRWLLFRGDDRFIRNYHFIRTVLKGHRSRTGLGMMLPVQNTYWGVPPQFAGTREKNWLTRAFDGLTEAQVADMMMPIVLKGLS